MDPAAPSSAPAAVAVFGACTPLGTHVCEALTEVGHEVVAFDAAEACLQDDPARGVLPSVVRGLGLEPAPVDPIHGPPRDVLEGVQWVIQAGLLHGPLEVEGDPARQEAIAVRGTDTLLRTCREAGVARVVLITSGEAYAPAEGAAAREDDTPLVPDEPLERHLSAAEQVALTCEAPQALVLRAGAVYGPRQAASWGAVLLTLARQPVLAWPRNVLGRVALVHARDVARAAVHLASLPEVHQRVFNVAGEPTLTARDALRLIALYSGNAFLDLPPVPRRTARRLLGGAAAAQRTLDEWLPPRLRPQRALPRGLLRDLERDLVLDTTRLAATGFALEVPEARRGLRDTLSWYKQEGWL